jgi:hypothetical protein
MNVFENGVFRVSKTQTTDLDMHPACLAVVVIVYRGHHAFRAFGGTERRGKEEGHLVSECNGPPELSHRVDESLAQPLVHVDASQRHVGLDGACGEEKLWSV